MNNITFNFKKEPIQKKSKGSYLLWGFLGLFLLGVFVFSCGSDNPVATEIPEHDHPLIESAALTELLNINQADGIVAGSIKGDDNDSTMVITFQTSTELNLFRYSGNTSVPINIVRGVEIWYENIQTGVTTDIGNSIGVVMNAVGSEVNTLEPGQFYYYLVQWNKDPFQFRDGEIILTTNFYALKGSTSRSLSKRAKANRYGIRLFQ